MAKFVLTNVRVLIGGADLSGDVNEATIVAKREQKDVTNYNSAGWKESIGGLGQATITVKGFTEAGSLSLPDDNGFANLGLLGGVTLAPQGAADGAVCYLTNALEDTFDAIQGKVGDVAGFQYTLQSSKPLVRGTIGAPPGTALVATGTGTIYNLGAVAAGQSIWADLHVISVAGTGSPTATFSVQSAALVGFGSPTTRITFGAATAIGGQFASAVGPITDTFWRVAWTISGSSPSFLASVAFGIA